MPRPVYLYVSLSGLLPDFDLLDHDNLTTHLIGPWKISGLPELSCSNKTPLTLTGPHPQQPLAVGPDTGREGVRLRVERQGLEGHEEPSLQPEVEMSPPPQLHQQRAERNRGNRETGTEGEGGDGEGTVTSSLILIHFILQNATQWKVGKPTKQQQEHKTRTNPEGK